MHRAAVKQSGRSTVGKLSRIYASDAAVSWRHGSHTGKKVQGTKVADACYSSNSQQPASHLKLTVQLALGQHLHC